MTHLQRASIHWQTDAQGHTVPVSDVFDDVYFSQAGGLAETHYVFLQGNHLPDRFDTLHDHQRFVIAETGFGTGLNFLATCLLWADTAPPSARLHFISTEKFPLSIADLRTALTAWRDERTTLWIDALFEQYPLLMAGCHRLHISETITLDLWLGDAYESFSSILATSTARQADGHTGAIQKVDAWFLDGFAPSKNSDLWSDELFALMAQLSANHATVATFTAAGFVRRGLMGAGFITKKIKGFGHKREMLTAHIDKPTTNHTAQPKSVAVIGAGISGVMSAIALSRRGHRVTVFDKHAPMSGASGNPRALLAPKLTLLNQAMHHLPTVSFLYAYRQYSAMNTKLNELDKLSKLDKNTQAHPAVFEMTGVVDFLLPSQKSAEKRAEQIADYPHALIHRIDNDAYPTADITSFVPMGGLINTASIRTLIEHDDKISFCQTNIERITADADGMTVMAQNGQAKRFDTAVICAGYESECLSDALFVCRKIRGQLSWLELDHIADDSLPSHPVKYDGYCASFCDDGVSKFLFGASFVRNSTDTTISDDEHKFNQDKLNLALPTLGKQITQALDGKPNKLDGKVGIRAQTPDYHPLVGQVSNKPNLYTLYGMGSKGFSFAPLCAEILADVIDGGILPIDKTLLDKLNPNRPRLQTPLSDV